MGKDSTLHYGLSKSYLSSHSGSTWHSLWHYIPTHLDRFFTYDVISELTFGRKFGFMEKEEDFHNLVSGLLVGLPLVGLTQRIKFLNNLLTSNWVADKVMPRPTDKDGIGAVMGVRQVPHLISHLKVILTRKCAVS